jgi:hypothetical protein
VTPENELTIDVTLYRVMLRNFEYRVAPLFFSRDTPYAYPAANGIELVLKARDTGLEVVLRFDRSEFVNMATAGLTMLDAADATEPPRGGNPQ